VKSNVTNSLTYPNIISSQIKKIENIIDSFSLTEKIIFYGFVGVFVCSSLILAYQVNKAYLVEIPASGGSMSEGIVGSPRFINPLLAISDADRDLTSLTYSGLLKASPDGTLKPDLAESYTVSPDGLTYTFIIKKNAVFSDGTEVTADDIEFTISKAQDPGLKSPRRNNWDAVKVQKIDAKTISFTLKQPYSPFIQNTTLGILPKHIWKNVDNDSFPFSSFNTKPVGAGPFIVKNIAVNGSGLPTEYTLISFSHYILGKPHIDQIHINFYQTESELLIAYQNGDIDNVNSISPRNVQEIKRTDGKILTVPLPRIFGVFFNQNQAPVFINKEVREALDTAVDKHALITEIMSGYGQPLDGPLPQDISLDTRTADTAIQDAKNILEKAGWTLNESGIYEKTNKKETELLSFSISTSNAPELKAAAQYIQTQWQKVGARVEIKIFEVGDLNQTIIRPRKYDALLFGEVLGRDLDLYPFWHSSARIDPGLNIALYANPKTDSILEEYRKTIDQDTRKTLLKNFETEIKSDTPAVFLYYPYFIYITSPEIKNIQLGNLTVSGERFLNINEWYINTSNVWKIFIHDDNKK
jgi:peptide/nickel transport system substrate-binding protein